MASSFLITKRVKGFTLIELMIVIVIVGILAAIVAPSYQNSVSKSRRADAQGALTSLANAMERYYTRNNTYVGATLGSDADDIFPDKAPIDGATKYYDLSIINPTASGYTLQATPIGGGPQNGDGPLHLTSTGVRTWDKDRNGSYSHTW